MRKSTSDKSINASALQDHLASSLGLPGAARSKRIPAPQKVSVSSKSASAHQNSQASGTSLVPLLSDSQKLERQLAAKWMCEKCKETNGGESSSCIYCKNPRVKVGVSNEKPIALTLAQSRGLVEMPRAALSLSEWNGVEARFAQRNDVRCVICLDFFGLRETLISHCSHAFHSICLQNLSRFLSQTTGGTPSCPVCRSSPLQTKPTRLPAASYVSRCITVMQARHRGRLQRRHYFQLRKSIYIGKAAGSNRRQAAFFAEALGDLNKALSAQGIASDRAREMLLNDIDENVEAARKILQCVDLRSAASSSASAHVFALRDSKSAYQGNDSSSILATSRSVVNPGIEAAAAAADARREAQERTDVHRASAALRLLDILSERLQIVTARQRRLQATRLQLSLEYERQQEVSARRAEAAVAGRVVDPANCPPTPVQDWNAVREMSLKIAQEDCAVCLVQLQGSSTTLISCGHVFHIACLNSYEKFIKGGGKSETHPKCVLCRQVYVRQDVAVVSR